MRDAVKQIMVAIWKDKMLHLYFLVYSEAWENLKMEDVLKESNRYLDFTFTHTLHDALMKEGYASEYTSPTAMDSWQYLLLPEVAAIAAKDAKERLNVIEGAVKEMFRDRSDLLALPKADVRSNERQLSPANKGFEELLQKLRKQSLWLIPTVNAMRLCYNDIMIRTRNSIISQKIIDAATTCRAEFPNIWNRLLVANHAAAFRTDYQFRELAEREIQTDFPINGSFEWLWVSDFVPNLSHAVDSFRNLRCLDTSNNDVELNSSLAEGRIISLPFQFDAIKPLPTGWTLEVARHMLSCQLQDPPPSDSQILAGVPFYLHNGADAQSKLANLTKGLRSFCETQGIQYPGRKMRAWIPKEEQILLKRTILKETPALIMERHLPNVRCAGSHLTELRGKYPGKMDTEILEISIKSHGDLTTENSLPKTNGTGSRFEPKETMLVFQAIVNDPDANAGDLARRCFPDKNKTRNSVYEHMKKVRSRFPGHSDAEILTHMIKNYSSGDFTAEVLFTVTAQSKWTARQVQILLKATCNEQSREYIKKNYLSHRSKTSIDDAFGNLHKKFPAKSAKQLLNGMIEEQGDLTLGLEGIDIFRPEGELPPKRGNKLGFGPQGFPGKSKSGVGGNDKKKVKKVKTFNDQ